MPAADTRVPLSTVVQPNASKTGTLSGKYPGHNTLWRTTRKHRIIPPRGTHNHSGGIPPRGTHNHSGGIPPRGTQHSSSGIPPRGTQNYSGRTIRGHRPFGAGPLGGTIRGHRGTIRGHRTFGTQDRPFGDRSGTHNHSGGRHRLGTHISSRRRPALSKRPQMFDAGGPHYPCNKNGCPQDSRHLRDAGLPKVGETLLLRKMNSSVCQGSADAGDELADPDLPPEKI